MAELTRDILKRTEASRVWDEPPNYYGMSEKNTTITAVLFRCHLRGENKRTALKKLPSKAEN